MNFTNIGFNKKPIMQDVVCSHGICLKCLGMENTWSIKFKWTEHKGHKEKNYYRVHSFVGGDTPIFVLKYTIANSIGIEADLNVITLTYQDIVLSDESKTLLDYNIPNGFITIKVNHSQTEYFQT